MNIKISKNIVTIFALLILQCCGPSKEEREAIKEAIKEEKEFAEKCGCNEVSDCLGKYKFEAARKYASKYGDYGGEKMRKIVTAEAFYWVNNKDYERALLTVDETAGDALGFGDHEKYKIRYQVLDKITEKLIDEGNFKEAKKWAFKASDDRNCEAWNAEEDNHFNKNETQRKVLLKKVVDAEKIFK